MQAVGDCLTSRPFQGMARSTQGSLGACTPQKIFLILGPLRLWILLSRSDELTIYTLLPLHRALFTQHTRGLTVASFPGLHRSYRCFSALFVLQATIAAVEAWERGQTDAAHSLAYCACVYVRYCVHNDTRKQKSGKNNMATYMCIYCALMFCLYMYMYVHVHTE